MIVAVEMYPEIGPDMTDMHPDMPGNLTNDNELLKRDIALLIHILGESDYESGKLKFFQQFSSYGQTGNKDEENENEKIEFQSKLLQHFIDRLNINQEYKNTLKTFDLNYILLIIFNELTLARKPFFTKPTIEMIENVQIFTEIKCQLELGCVRNAQYHIINTYEKSASTYINDFNKALQSWDCNMMNASKLGWKIKS